MSETRVRRKHTFRVRLLEHLHANPGAQLRIRVAAKMFFVSYHTARTAIYLMRKDGELGPGPRLKLPEQSK